MKDEPYRSTEKRRIEYGAVSSSESRTGVEEILWKRWYDRVLSDEYLGCRE